MNEVFIRSLLLTELAGTAFIWTITTPYSFRRWLSNLLTLRGIIIACLEIIIFLEMINIINMPLPATLLNDLFAALGSVLSTGGVALAIWAKFAMQGSWGPPAQHDIKRQNKLVISGPFAFSRNPLYLGLFVFLFGLELALRSYFILLVMPVGFLIYKAVIKEEKLLEGHFGKEYLAYKGKVPRFL
jgi:protein-S-isoprenylcysteine O-methyltransferase Ste14